MVADAPTPAASRRALAARQLAEAGIIAHIRGDFSTPALIEIGDALLAAPIAAVLLATTQPDALNAIPLLRQRGREFLLVGASEVETVADVEQAAAAGAQFVLSPYLHDAAALRAAALDVLYVPGVLSVAEAVRASACGHRQLCYAPADILGLDYLGDLRQAVPDATFFAAGGIADEQVGLGRRLGAAGLVVDDALISGSRWTQAEIITAARNLQNAWEQNQPD